MPTRKSKLDTLFSLNKLEIVIGLIGGVITCLNFYGVYSVLPYRVGKAEEAIAEIHRQTEIDKKSTTADHDLLVRIDERLNQLQQSLKTQEKQKP